MNGRSDSKLTAQVEAAQRKDNAERVAKGLPAHRAKTPTVAAGLHLGGVMVRPIDAMQRLTRVTALTVSDDIYAFYSHWGWLRYLGAFDWDGSPPTLALENAAVANVHANQLRVLSEELGVGFGVLLAEEWCRAIGARGTIRTTDVDKALRRPSGMNLAKAPGARRQPDYLMQFASAADPNAQESVLLETKGTATSSYAVAQLAHATTQLALLLLNGRSLQGVAISTVSSGRRLEYRAVDPDGDSTPWVPQEDDIEAARHHKPRSTEIGEVTDTSKEEFLASATVTANASLADFAGLYDAARAWLPQDEILGTRAARITEQRQIGGADYRGVEFRIPTPSSGGVLTVFQGVEREVEEALISGRDDRVRQAQERFVSNRGSQVLTSQPIDTADSEAIAVSNEGAVLKVALAD
jgi:hypothetical protein